VQRLECSRLIHFLLGIAQEKIVIATVLSKHISSERRMCRAHTSKGSSAPAHLEEDEHTASLPLDVVGDIGPEPVVPTWEPENPAGGVDTFSKLMAVGGELRAAQASSSPSA